MIISDIDMKREKKKKREKWEHFNLEYSSTKAQEKHRNNFMWKANEKKIYGLEWDKSWAEDFALCFLLFP